MDNQESDKTRVQRHASTITIDATLSLDELLDLVCTFLPCIEPKASSGAYASLSGSAVFWLCSIEIPVDAGMGMRTDTFMAASGGTKREAIVNLLEKMKQL